MFSWVKKITDMIMPIDPGLEEQVEEETVEKKQAETAKTQKVNETASRRAAGGSAEHYPAGYVNTSTTGTASMNGVTYEAYTDNTERPNLKVIKAPELTMRIYRPSDYSQVSGIADDILAKKAVVVNYEYVSSEEQRRVCDFIDGACYAIDGSVTKISERIFLYVPAGIDTKDIAALAAASMRYR